MLNPDPNLADPSLPTLGGPPPVDPFIQSLAALGIGPEELAMFLRQSDQGYAATQTPSAQGRNVGSTYVASSPLEHLSVALERGMGGRQQQAADEGYRSTLGRMAGTRGEYMGRQQNNADEQIRALIEAYRQQGGNLGPSGWGNGY
jgi:hypothetical protein